MARVESVVFVAFRVEIETEIQAAKEQYRFV
jgi:hypothetical protein